MNRPPTLTDAQWTALQRIAKSPKGLSNFSGDGFRSDTADVLERLGLIRTVWVDVHRPTRSLYARHDLAPPKSARHVVERVVAVTPAGLELLAERTAVKNPPRRFPARTPRRRA